MSSMWRARPSPLRRERAATIWRVRLSTVSCTRRELEAEFPSTARNALVTATEILEGSNGERAPLRRMTWKPRAGGAGRWPLVGGGDSRSSDIVELLYAERKETAGPRRVASRKAKSHRNRRVR